MGRAVRQSSKDGACLISCDKLWVFRKKKHTFFGNIWAVDLFFHESLLLPQHVLLCVRTHERAPMGYIDENLTGECKQNSTQ